MKNKNRRDFLRAAVEAAGATAALNVMPLGIRQALAIPANNRHGSIEDIEHIVVLMQENRSFDHYFGTLRGVRGCERVPIDTRSRVEVAIGASSRLCTATEALRVTRPMSTR